MLLNNTPGLSENRRVSRVPKRARCSIHEDVELICPRCIGSRGGKATTQRHYKKLSRWGKTGGRPQKKK